MEKSTKRKLIIGGSLLVVLGVGGYFLYDYLKKQKAEKDAKKLQEEQPVIGGGNTGGGSTGGSGYTFPFKTTAEGNAFRAWVNDTYPAYAKSIQLDRKGSLNSYVQKAWVKYGAEYQKKTGVASNTETPVADQTIRVGDKVIAIKKTRAFDKNYEIYSYGGDGGGYINANSYAGIIKGVAGSSVKVENYDKPVGLTIPTAQYYLAKGDLKKIS